MTSVCWPITLTGPSGKSSTQQEMRPWCPLYVSLCLHPTKRLLIWLQGEMLGFILCIRSDGCCWLVNLTFLVSSFSCRTEQLYQNVLALWHRSHINMKSVASWHYLMADIRAIRNWNVASVCLNSYGFIIRLDHTIWWSHLFFDDHFRTNAKRMSYFHFYSTNHCR